MAKGIAAAMGIVALILAMSVLGGLGFYNGIAMEVGSDANDDVQQAQEEMINQEPEDRGSSALEDLTTAAGTTLSVLGQIIGNTSGVLQLLLMLPPELADAIQTFIRITFGLTFLAFLRGVVW